jgi:hypothetical protein
MRAAPTRLLCAVALAAAFLPASSATASEVTSNGSTVTYTAAPGESNSLLVSIVEYESLCGAVGAPCLSVWDSGARIRAVSGACQLVQSDPIVGDTAHCSVPASVTANLGDRDDSYWDWDGPSTVDAGTGNDNPIHGGGGDDVLRGGPGADLLEGVEGDDLLDGGPGDDLLDGVPGGWPDESMTHGSDTYVGGGGYDSVTYEERTEDLALSPDGVANDGASGERDDIGTDVMLVVGGHGADVMTGSGGRNVFGGAGGDDALTGAGGDDQLAGGGGADRLTGDDGQDVLGGDDGDDLLVGGAGVDRFYGDDITACIAAACASGRDDIRARDGVREEINCGPGVDTLEHDANDVLYDSVSLSDQCEGALGVPAGAGGGGESGLRITDATVSRRNRIAVRLAAPAAGTAGARAVARVAGARIRVGRATRAVAQAGEVTLTLKPSRAARRALERRKRLKVSVKATFRPQSGDAVRAPARKVTLRAR